jgi:hypothetical protein
VTAFTGLTDNMRWITNIRGQLPVNTMAGSRADASAPERNPDVRRRTTIADFKIAAASCL